MPKSQPSNRSSSCNDFDLNLLSVAVDEKRRSLGLSWSGVAKEIENQFTKVAVSTIKGLGQKQYVEGDGCLQVLLWLGKSPESFVEGTDTDERQTLDKPRSGTLRFDLVHTYRLLDEQRKREGLGWNDVARQIGRITPQMLRRFKSGGRTTFPGIMRVARWLGVPVKELTGKFPR